MCVCYFAWEHLRVCICLFVCVCVYVPACLCVCLFSHKFATGYWSDVDLRKRIHRPALTVQLSSAIKKKIMNFSSRNLEVIILQLFFKHFLLPLRTNPIAVKQSPLMVVLVTEKFSWLDKFPICRVLHLPWKMRKIPTSLPLLFFCGVCFRTVRAVVSIFWQSFRRLRPLKSGLVILINLGKHWEKLRFEIETFWRKKTRTCQRQININ